MGLHAFPDCANTHVRVLLEFTKVTQITEIDLCAEALCGDVRVCKAVDEWGIVHMETRVPRRNAVRKRGNAQLAWEWREGGGEDGERADQRAVPCC